MVLIVALRRLWRLPNLNALVVVSKGMQAGSKTLLQQNMPVLKWGCGPVLYDRIMTIKQLSL